MSKLRFEDDLLTPETPKKKKLRRQKRPSDGVKSERGGNVGNNAETKSTENIRQTEGDSQNLNNTAKIGNSDDGGDNQYDKPLETRDRVNPQTNANKTELGSSHLETKPKDNSKIRHKRKRIIDSDGKIINGDVGKKETSPKKRRNSVKPLNIGAAVNNGVVVEEKTKYGSEVSQEVFMIK